MFTKLNLSDFDRYLVILVLSLIVKWNSVDFYNPLPNQIEWRMPASSESAALGLTGIEVNEVGTRLNTACVSG